MKPYLLLLVALMAGCQSKPKPATDNSSTVQVVTEHMHPNPYLLLPCRDEINHAVMIQVQEYVGNDLNWANSYEATPEAVSREQANIDRMFEWSKTVPDKTMASCYEGWLGYYQHQLNESIAERGKEQAQAQWAASHKLPNPPEAH